MCAARAKVHENLFRALHAELLRRAGETAMGPRWKGHRLFAVDGTKLNLPRPLVAAGYRTPSDNAHYPQGLSVACVAPAAIAAASRRVVGGIAIIVRRSGSGRLPGSSMAKLSPPLRAQRFGFAVKVTPGRHQSISLSH